MRCIYGGEHPCGKCPACMLNRQRAFAFRLDQEKENASFYYWLTLQYDDEHVPRLKHYPGKFPLADSEEMCFSKEHCRHFFEFLRKKYASSKISFKHFLVSEYGPNCTFRPHYHCLLLVYAEGYTITEKYQLRQSIKEVIISSAWQYGHVTEKSFHGRVLSYLTKYCLKPELLGQYHTMKPFTLISKGIGKNFLDTLSDHQKKQMIDSLDFTFRYGKSKISLPRYYTDKLVPHSKALLDSFAISEDWESYDRLVNLRKKFKDRQAILGERSFVHDYENKDFREIEIRRNGVKSNFIAKVKKRKDL